LTGQPAAAADAVQARDANAATVIGLKRDTAIRECTSARSI